MSIRFLSYATAATLLFGLAALAADAWVVSDREELDALAARLTEEAPATVALDQADLSRQSVRVLADPLNGWQRFDGQPEEAALADALADALAPLSSGAEVVQRLVSVEPRGDAPKVGVIAYRLRADEAVYDITLRAKRLDDAWVLRSVSSRERRDS